MAVKTNEDESGAVKKEIETGVDGSIPKLNLEGALSSADSDECLSFEGALDEDLWMDTMYPSPSPQHPSRDLNTPTIQPTEHNTTEDSSNAAASSTNSSSVAELNTSNLVGLIPVQYLPAPMVLATASDYGSPYVPDNKPPFRFTGEVLQQYMDTRRKSLEQKPIEAPTTLPDSSDTATIAAVETNTVTEMAAVQTQTKTRTLAQSANFNYALALLRLTPLIALDPPRQESYRSVLPLTRALFLSSCSFGALTCPPNDPLEPFAPSPPDCDSLDLFESSVKRCSCVSVVPESELREIFHRAAELLAHSGLTCDVEGRAADVQGSSEESNVLAVDNPQVLVTYPNVATGEPQAPIRLCPHQVSLSALRSWFRLGLQPYSPHKDISYVAVVPLFSSTGSLATPRLIGRTRHLFRQVDAVYALLHLGNHQPFESPADENSPIRSTRHDKDMDAEDSVPANHVIALEDLYIQGRDVLSALLHRITNSASRTSLRNFVVYVVSDGHSFRALFSRLWLEIIELYPSCASLVIQFVDLACVVKASDVTKTCQKISFEAYQRCLGATLTTFGQSKVANCSCQVCSVYQNIPPRAAEPLFTLPLTESLTLHACYMLYNARHDPNNPHSGKGNGLLPDRISFAWTDTQGRIKDAVVLPYESGCNPLDLVLHRGLSWALRLSPHYHQTAQRIRIVISKLFTPMTVPETRFWTSACQRPNVPSNFASAQSRLQNILTRVEAQGLAIDIQLANLSFSCGCVPSGMDGENPATYPTRTAAIVAREQTKFHFGTAGVTQGPLLEAGLAQPEVEAVVCQRLREGRVLACHALKVGLVSPTPDPAASKSLHSHTHQIAKELSHLCFVDATTITSTPSTFTCPAHVAWVLNLKNLDQSIINEK